MRTQLNSEAPAKEHQLNATSMPVPDPVVLIDNTTCNAELRRSKGKANDALDYHALRDNEKPKPAQLYA